MDDIALDTPPQGVTEDDAQRTRRRLGRLARDRDSLREMRAILNRIYGKGAVTTYRDSQS
jgi:hypothetical protein